MEEQKKKQITLFLVGLFVVAAFVSSVAAYGNNNTTNTFISSTSVLATYAVFGSTTATVIGYGDSATINIKNNSNSTSSALTALLNGLKGSGGISDFSTSGTGVDVLLSNLSAYALQQSVLNLTDSSANVSAAEILLLPRIAKLYYYGSPVNALIGSKNISFGVTGLSSIGSELNVSISALINPNGSIYNNQMTVSLEK